VRAGNLAAMTVKTIVVDDHAIVRRGIVQIVAEHPDVSVVAEAGDYGQLRTALRQHGDVDLVVMDVSLPGKNGIDILKVLREEMPRLKVLIVSMYPEDQYAVRAFRAGAAGYLNKASAPEKLVEAISQVIAGRKYGTTPPGLTAGQTNALEGLRAGYLVDQQPINIEERPIAGLFAHDVSPPQLLEQRQTAHELTTEGAAPAARA